MGNLTVKHSSQDSLQAFGMFEFNINYTRHWMTDEMTYSYVGQHDLFFCAEVSMIEPVEWQGLSMVDYIPLQKQRDRQKPPLIRDVAQEKGL